MKRILVLILLVFQSLWLLAQDLSYYKAVSPLEEIKEVKERTFIGFEGKLNKGTENGVYWLKLKDQSEEVVCEISSAHLRNVECFIEDTKYPTLSGTVFPTFIIPKSKTAFFKVTCDKEAFIPVKITSSSDFNKVENRSLLSSGLYYGFAMMVLVMNLFYYFSLRERSFLYYSVFLFFISLSLFQRDGFIGLFIEGGFNLSYLEVITHFFVALTGTVFAIDYLNIETYWKRYKALLLGLNASVLISLITYIITDSFFWMELTELLVISILILIWFSGVTLFRKNTYSKIFVIAYVFILLMAFDFFISPLMGWANLGITTKYLKIAGVLEMLLLSYAVVYRMKELHRDYKSKERQLYNYTKELHSLEEELQKHNEGKENDISADVLSPREIEILELIAAGKINKEIAAELYISVNTVKYHTKKLYAKLNIKSRSEIQPGFIESLN